MTAMQLAHGLRRSPAVWVLVATLIPAVVCTLLARYGLSE